MTRSPETGGHQSNLTLTATGVPMAHRMKTVEVTVKGTSI
jgi:hypothetical protein